MQGQDVGACAIEDREGFDAAAELLFQDLLEPGGVDVLAVGDLVASVGGSQSRQDLGVDSGIIVRRKASNRGVVELAVAVCGGGAMERLCCARHWFIHAFKSIWPTGCAGR